MKKSIWAIAFAMVMASGSVFASATQNNEIAVYEFGTRMLHNATDTQYQTVRVSVNNEGVVTAAVLPLTLIGDIDLPKPILEEASKQLSPLAFASLKNQLIRLSSAKLETYESQVICMIAVSPDMMVDHLQVAEDFSYDTDLFHGNLRLVLSPQGCWTGGGTFPKHDHVKQTALSLKKILEMYGFDLLEK